MVALTLALWLAGAPTAFQSVQETQEYVWNVDPQESGDILFRFMGTPARYRLRQPTEEQLERAYALLQTSIDAKRSIRLSYDIAGGRIDEKLRVMVYPLCGFRFDELAFAQASPCQSKPLTLEQLKKEDAFAYWVAQAYSGDTDASIAALGTIASEKGLSSGSRLVALEARAFAAESAGDAAKFGSPESDAFYLAALRDSQAVLAIDPERDDVPENIAHLLANLGDYDASLAAFRAIIAKDSSRESDLLVSVASVNRSQGKYEDSLAALATSATKNPDGKGMRYYYHRGWTLSAMGRYDEAVASFTSGMETQADYPWSYVMRGCAHAAVGDFNDAADDVRHGLSIFQRFALDDSVSTRQGKERIEAILKKTEEARARKSAPMPNLCEELAGPGDRKRAKSPLLAQPPAAPTS